MGLQISTRRDENRETNHALDLADLGRTTR